MHCFKENLDKWAVAWNTVTYCPKYTLYSSVKVFSTKVPFGDTILRLQLEPRPPWSSEPRVGLASCRAKGVPSFLSYFKTLSVGSALGIELTTSCSAVKRSTD